MKNVISSSLISFLILLIIATGFILHRYCNPEHSNVPGAETSENSIRLSVDSVSITTELGAGHLLVIRK